MAKKKNKKKSAQKNQQETSPAVYGTMLIGIGFTIYLSLSNFGIANESHHLLGLTGHAIGWVFYKSFGLSSYLISLFLLLTGFKLLLSKPVQNFSSKCLYLLILVSSLSFCFSLIEAKFPTFHDFLRNHFYPVVSDDVRSYHLGGSPFFYIYHDLPSYNLNRMFNTTGMLIIFSSAILTSLLLLTEMNPKELYLKWISFIQKIKEKTPSFSEPVDVISKEKESINKNSPKENSSNLDLKVESDFMRYVKLRLPSILQNSGNNEVSNKEAEELLAIHPETNLTSRPSLSKKEPVESEDVKKLKAIKEASKKETSEKEIIQETAKDIEKPLSLKEKRSKALESQLIHNGDFTKYELPPLSLLTTPKKVDQSTLKNDLKKQAEVLEETLASFGIEAKVGQINCGPTITSFEVHPSIGVKVQKIKTLENDIALNMEAKSIRIIAPIPGKAAVGIEVPNSKPQEVGFKDMLQAYKQGPQKFHIPVLLGKAVNGDYVMSDLSKMPHCIIAGATGSGKSVCINTIVMSIVHNAKPDEIKLIMVDPKKVELTAYSKLPHMLAPVITEPRGASNALNFLVKEMERRYEMLKNLGVRNIEAFNGRKIDVEFEKSLGFEVPEKMHYIVAIIDELADLMMVASSDIETPIARIAQMARAVGIHLILATQRPSREVITGLIKANFPTRISFKVASRVNSQIVLDEIGAESLLGNGDMLFLPPGASHLIRAQGAFIRDEDINQTVKFISDQAPPNYVIQSFDHSHEFSSSEGFGEDDSPSDSLYKEAESIVLSTGNASTTFLQRKLKIGYARAASLMDQLESRGIVTPPDGSKARKVLGGKQLVSSSDTLNPSESELDSSF